MLLEVWMSTPELAVRALTIQDRWREEENSFEHLLLDHFHQTPGHGPKNPEAKLKT